jgi:hypothetical protein
VKYKKKHLFLVLKMAIFGLRLHKKLQKAAAHIMKFIMKEVVITICQNQIFDVG